MSSLSQLAKLMATFNFLQGKKVSYGQVERFLKKSWQTGPFIIFSCPLDRSHMSSRSPNELVRVSWNRRALGGHYKVDLIESFYPNILNENPDLGMKERGDKSYFLFECGETNSQKFYGFFELGPKIEEEALELLTLFLCNISKAWNRLDELKKVENLVHVDDVTGLYNQRKLLKDVDNAVERYKDFKEVFTILFIDVDHFKNVNDGHGHLVGTQILAQLGALLKKTLRESDLIYRYGGDEFVMIIPDVSGDTAKSIGDRVLNVVRDSTFLVDSSNEKKEFNITVSIGVATFPDDAKNRTEVLEIADKMMYEAKKSGRGRVCYTREILS